MSESDFEKFKKTWEELIAKIENNPIDGDGVHGIRLHFDIGKLKLHMDSNESELVHSIYFDTEMLESKLEVALMVAHSKFRLANRGALARFFGGLTDRIPTKEILGKK
jgi:hypothetical protein